MKDFKKLEKTLEVEFKNHLLLKEALTHRSFLNENPEWAASHNERLEFLGDAVLELIVTEELFHKFPAQPEGMLTSIRSALVNHQMLAQVAGNIGLDKYIYLSKGEAHSAEKAREAIYGNAVEALIGAIYLDQGYEKARGFINGYILSNLESVMEDRLYEDPKSLLQETVQEKMKLTPVYNVIEESGPDHQKTFKVGVYFDEKLAAEGEGESKQEAERQAAYKALEQFEET